MIVEKPVSRTVNSELYNMLLKAIIYEGKQNDSVGRKEIAPLMYKLYNVRISELTKLEDGTNIHMVRFDSEEDLILFILRWS